MASPNTTCTWGILPGGPGEFEVRLAMFDSTLFGMETEFRVVVEAHVHEPEGASSGESGSDWTALHGRETVFTEQVTLAKAMVPIHVSLRDEEAYLYDGKLMDIRLYAVLTLPDGEVLEERIDAHSLALSYLNPAFDTSSRLYHEPTDNYGYWANFVAIGRGGKIAVVVLSLLLVVGIFAGFGFMFQNGFSLLSSGVLVGSLVIALFSWGGVIAVLSSYARLTMKSIPDPSRGGRKLRIGELFEGESSIDLENVTLQIVAWNEERGKLQKLEAGKEKPAIENVGGRTREMVIFEKHLAYVPKGRPIQSFVDDLVPFSTLFSRHCPPLKIGDRHAIGFGWEIHLIHPKLVDVKSEPVVEYLEDYRTEDGDQEFYFQDFVEYGEIDAHARNEESYILAVQAAQPEQAEIAVPPVDGATPDRVIPNDDEVVQVGESNTC